MYLVEIFKDEFLVDGIATADQGPALGEQRFQLRASLGVV